MIAKSNPKDVPLTFSVSFPMLINKKKSFSISIDIRRSNLGTIENSTLKSENEKKCKSSSLVKEKRVRITKHGFFVLL